MPELHVFGDSHWRNFFPFTNHGGPLVYEDDGISIHDSIGNSLSGATMYGLLNESSKNGARRYILNRCDSLGGVDNVGLTFGEVDARFHINRYFNDRQLLMGKLYELISRYRRFIDEDLMYSGRVRGKIFVYYGYAYTRSTLATIDQGSNIAISKFHSTMNNLIEVMIPMGSCDRIVPICCNEKLLDGTISDGGAVIQARYALAEDQRHEVHLSPNVYHDFVRPIVRTNLL